MNVRSARVLASALSAALIAGSLFHSANAAGQAKDVSIDDDDKTTTVECRGNAVAVTGDDNQISITGQCTRLTVDGDDNRITAATVNDVSVSGDDNSISLETVGRISASGDDNTIAWKKSSGGKSPEISNTGDDNRIEQRN